MKVEKYETLAIQAFDKDFKYLGRFQPSRNAMTEQKFYSLANLKKAGRNNFKPAKYFKVYKQDSAKVSFFQWYDRKGKRITISELNKMRGLDLD